MKRRAPRPALAALTIGLLPALFFPASAAATLTTSTTAAKSAAGVAFSARVTLSDVQFEGFHVFDAAQLGQALASKMNIKAGQMVSQATLEEGRKKIEETYAQAGFPFTPAVKLTTTTQPDGKTTAVVYSVDETAPLSRVDVSGATLLKSQQIQAIFKPLSDSKKLTATNYTVALTQLAQAYSEAGYIFRADNVQAKLSGGILNVHIAEPFVQTVDTSGLALSAQAAPMLQTRPDTALSMNALNDDARTLSNLTGRPVQWQADDLPAQAGADAGAGPARVRVTFSEAEGMQPEKITSVVIQGNDHVSAAQIRQVLRLREGDIATPQLAQQDFYAIQKLYDDLGYALAATDDSLSFSGGVLAFHLREAKIAGYVLNWPNNQPLLNEKVALHALPVVGSAVQRQQIRAGLGQLQGYDNIQLTGQQTRSDDPEHPERLTFVLDFARRQHSLPVGAAVSYSTQTGLGGEANFGSNNLFGTGQGLNLTLGANSNDVGQHYSGSVNYSIPWINSNFLDFGQRPTSLNLSAWSSATGNNALYVKGSDGLATDTDTGRQYTVRSTGLSATAGRNLTPALVATAGLTVARSNYYLEPYKAADSSAVTDSNRAAYQSDTAATAEMPLGALTALPTLGLQYDTTDSALAPSFGVRAATTLGYGLGRQSDGAALSWGQVEAGGSTYLGFGATLPDGSKQEVLAGRINAGTIVGNGGEGNVFSVGSGTSNPAYELRGQSSTLHGTSYLTTSAELRHNFGVKLGDYVSGVYALAFVDAGDAWTQNSTSNKFGLNLAYGVGAQVNTSLINLQLSYGRTNTGTGKFAVRIGKFW